MSQGSSYRRKPKLREDKRQVIGKRERNLLQIRRPRDGGGEEGSKGKDMKKELKCILFMPRLLVRNVVVMCCKHAMKNNKNWEDK